MEIRISSESDQPDLSELVRQAYPEYDFRGVAPEVRQESQLFVAEEQQRPVGFALVALREYGMGPPSGELLELVVDPDHRRQGVATRLVEQSVIWLAGRGAPIVYLNAQTDEARHLYEALGFEAKESSQMYRLIDRTRLQDNYSDPKRRGTGIYPGDVSVY
jgi:GNAT superfamily N-acetyltransferase